MRLLAGLTTLSTIPAAAATATAATYDVGPGRTYENIDDVPLGSLGPGDVVEIYWRAEPYRERFGIDTAGTASEPIVIRGVPSDSGALPVIDGEGSTGGYNSHTRGLIHVGGDAAWLLVENLELRNANASSGLSDNSAAVFAPGGSNLTFRNLDIHHNGNGFFTWVDSSNVLVQGCHLHENGNVGSIYEHNVYTESDGITFEYNVLAPLLAGAGGNNLKDRSHSVVIRYNWIEGGNRCLDLVDAEDGGWVYSDAADYVYGNVLIKHDDTSQSQIVHYGGDNASAPDRQQLYFFHNTVYTDRPGNSTIFFVNAAASVGAYNNVFITGGGDLELLDPDDSSAAVVDLGANWIAEGWFVGGSSATVTGQGSLVVGDDPGLTDVPTDFSPLAGSPVLGAGDALPGTLGAHPVDQEFGGQGRSVARNDGGAPDLGAFALESSAGGAPGAGGGTGTGGVAGTGGSAGTGGVPGTGGGAGTGGGDATTGGVGGRVGGATGAGGNPTGAGGSDLNAAGGDGAAAAGSDDAGGCRCLTPAPASPAPRGAALAWLLVALAVARRRL